MSYFQCQRNKSDWPTRHGRVAWLDASNPPCAHVRRVHCGLQPVAFRVLHVATTGFCSYSSSRSTIPSALVPAATLSRRPNNARSIASNSESSSQKQVRRCVTSPCVTGCRRQSWPASHIITPPRPFERKRNFPLYRDRSVVVYYTLAIGAARLVLSVVVLLLQFDIFLLLRPWLASQPLEDVLVRFPVAGARAPAVEREAKSHLAGGKGRRQRLRDNLCTVVCGNACNTCHSDMN